MDDNSAIVILMLAFFGLLAYIAYLSGKDL